MNREEENRNSAQYLSQGMIRYQQQNNEVDKWKFSKPFTSDKRNATETQTKGKLFDVILDAPIRGKLDYAIQLRSISIS